MFIRKKRNKSGTISVFVLSTTKSRKQRLVKSFGSAHPCDTAAMEKQLQQASSFIQEMEGPSLPHIYEEEDVIDGFVSSLNNAQVQVAGPELVFGTLYDRIGYGAIRNRMFRNTVICRLFNPGSKLKTVDYMERYLHVTYSVDQIYRFLDNLCHRKEEEEKDSDGRKPEIAAGESESTSPAKPRPADFKTLVEYIAYSYTKKMASGRLTKQNINNRGYNKYLKMEGEVTISINMERYEADAAWDGIKGYLTNTTLEKGEVIASYSNLWFIERAFRMNKFDLAVRPIYHRLRNRIEGHICICFTAYTIMLELERILKAAKSEITIYRAQELVKNMYVITYTLPKSKQTKRVYLGMDEEQSELCQLVVPDWRKGT